MVRLIRQDQYRVEAIGKEDALLKQYFLNTIRMLNGFSQYDVKTVLPLRCYYISAEFTNYRLQENCGVFHPAT